MKRNFFHIKTPEKLDCEIEMKLIFFMSFPSQSHNIGLITLIHFLNNCLLEKKKEKKNQIVGNKVEFEKVLSVFYFQFQMKTEK